MGTIFTPRSRRPRRAGSPDGAFGRGAGPQLLGVEIGHQRRQAADVVLVRVRERHDVHGADAAVPQVGRHHVFADIELRPGCVAECGDAAAIHQHALAIGERPRRMLSPCPTSMAVISSRPG